MTGEMQGSNGGVGGTRGPGDRMGREGTVGEGRDGGG